MRLPLLKRLPHSWHLYRCLLFCLPSFFTCLEWQKGHFLCSKVLTPFKALQDKACGEFWHLFCYLCRIFGFNVGYNYKDRLNLRAGVSNLFDKTILRTAGTARTYNERRRSYYMSVKYSF